MNKKNNNRKNISLKSLILEEEKQYYYNNTPINNNIINWIKHIINIYKTVSSDKRWIESNVYIKKLKNMIKSYFRLSNEEREHLNNFDETDLTEFLKEKAKEIDRDLIKQLNTELDKELEKVYRGTKSIDRVFK